MTERQDYMALEWVVDDISESLVQAKAALAAFAEEDSNIENMRLCLTHVHQVHGTLQMVQFFGAALLVREIEKLAERLVDGSVSEHFLADAVEVLQHVLNQLPNYLTRIVATKRDLPAVLLSLINDLRAVRGEPLLSETALFNPNIDLASVAEQTEEVAIAADELNEIATKLRQMYQVALLGFIRNRDVSKNLNYLAKVCARLVKLTAGRSQQAMWKIAIAMLEGLLNKSIKPGASVKILLRQLDREIKKIIADGVSALDAEAPQDLMKNMLFYVSQSGAESRFIKEIKDQYQLDSLMLGDDSLEEENISGPDVQVVNDIIEVVRNQTVELGESLRADKAVPAAIKKLGRIVDTLAVLGITGVLPQYQTLYDALVYGSKTQTNDDQILTEWCDRLQGLAERLPVLEVEQKEEAMFNDNEEAQQHLDAAFISVCRESRAGLEQAKESIIEFVATQWNKDSLADVPALLLQISGGLHIVPLKRAADVVEACERYIREEILGVDAVPEWQTLDTLADAITSIDYYLERILDDPNNNGDEILLVAEESIAHLLGEESFGESAAVETAPEEAVSEESVDAQRSEAELEETSVDAVNVQDETVDEFDVAEPVASEIEEEPLAQEVDEQMQSAEVIPLHQNIEKEIVAEVSLPAEEEQEPSVEQLDDAQSDITQSSQQEEAVDDVDDEIDPEIAEIFVEEAEEVLETINEYFPQWQENPNNDDVFVEIRRAFHTLKGSGRMVGATTIGEFAWSIENMLNRVIDGAFIIDSARIDVVDEARNLIPELVEAFKNRDLSGSAAADVISNKAVLLTEQQSLPNEQNDIAASSNEVEANTVETSEEETVVTSIDLDASTDSDDSADLDNSVELLSDSADSLSEIVDDGEATIAEAVSDDASDNVSDEMEEAFDASEFNDDFAELAAVETDDIQMSDQLVDALNLASTDESHMFDPSEQEDLTDVFVIETATHIETVEGFIAHARSIPGTVSLSDELQLALHTLKGSAHMAGVTELALLVTPVEKYVKELRAAQHKADDDIVGMLEKTVVLVNQLVAQLPAEKIDLSEEAQQFITDVDQRCDSLFTETSATSDSSASEALAAFLGSALEDLQTISDELEVKVDDEIPQLPVATRSDWSDKLANLEALAAACGVENYITLSQALEQLCRESLVVAPQEIVAKDFVGLLLKATHSLIDILDQVAGEQQPALPEALCEALQDYRFEDVIDVDAEDDELETDSLAEELLSPEADTASNPDEVVADDAVFDVIAEVEDFSLEEESSSADSIFAETLESDSAAQESNPELENIQQEEDIVAESIEGVIEEHDGVAPEVPEELVTDSAEQEDGIQGELVESDDSVVEDTDSGLHTVDVADDDIDPEILEIFLEEAADILESIDENVHELSADLNNKTYFANLQRDLHTLKGGARLAGLKALGDVSHDFETLLIEVEESGNEVGSDLLGKVQGYQDQLIKLVAAANEGDFSIPETLSDSVSDQSSVVVEEVAGEPEVIQGSSEESKEDHSTATEEPVNRENIVPFNKPVPPSPEAPPPARRVSNLAIEPATDLNAVAGQNTRRAPAEMVKVSAHLLEELVNLAGETSISRGRAEEQVSDLTFALEEMQITVFRLLEQVRRLDRETEAQILFRQEQVESEGLENFDPLEMDRYSQLQHLSRALLESSSDLLDIKHTLFDKSRDIETLLGQQSRINTELQEGLMRSRMVPFARMVPRLRRIARQVSGELGKSVDFRFDNVEGELDRTVLERVVPPLEHMLRNAVDHGIEDPQARRKAGKPEAGKVVLSMGREGGEVVITLEDDGRGVDLAAVKNKAIERGLILPGAELSDHEILQFILQSGFSTAKEVTQISGRGVGMDVVNSEIKQLGGSIDIQSKHGQGTRFVVRLPFTVSVNRALMVNAGGDIYAIPLNTIEGIVRVSPFELEAYYQPDAPLFEYAGQPYMLRYMGGMLGNKAKPVLHSDSMPLPVLLVRSQEHSVAVQVDSLLGSREIVVKPLGPQFGAVQGLSGATVLGDGSVVVILDLMAMIRTDASRLHRDVIDEQPQPHETHENRLVMVVDDSVTVRKVTTRFLEREGMDVITAKDGVDAITQLHEMSRIPDIMLLDIEMPRMDGFEVASRVRHDSELKDLPIVMITSRTGEKHRERAMSLGVNEYLGKPYQESHLLKIIEETLAAKSSLLAR